MGVSKNRGNNPKMDVENFMVPNPMHKWMIGGGKNFPPIFGNCRGLELCRPFDDEGGLGRTKPT